MASILSPPCNFDWCFVPQDFVRRHFVRAPRDMSRYKMSKYEISITRVNPRPLFREVLYLPLKCLHRNIQKVSTIILSTSTYEQCPKCSEPHTACRRKKYLNYSKSMLQPVHSSKSSQQHNYFISNYLYISFKTQYSFLILSPSVARCTALIYNYRNFQTFCPRTSLKAAPVSRFTKEVLEPTVSL